MDKKTLKGFVEEDDSLLPFELQIDGEDFIFYVGGELGDHVETLEDLTDFYNDTYFASKKDFKNDKSSRFTDWLEE